MLTLDLGAPHQVLSWAINRPVSVRNERILWRELRNADLPRDLDVHRWRDEELATRGEADTACFLTSRDVGAHHETTATVEEESVRALATVGLSNAERVGARVDRRNKDWGTINIAVIIRTGLTEAVLIEAGCTTAQARTVAVMEAGLQLPTGLATGTGTDCIAVASPDGPCAYAVLYTDIGAAIGQSVIKVMRAGLSEWMATQFRGEAG